MNDRVDLNPHIDSIKERAGQALAVTPTCLRGARAVPCPTAARAGIGGKDEQELGRVLHGTTAAMENDASGFERLTQCIERTWGELRSFVQKEDAAMSERDCSRPG